MARKGLGGRLERGSRLARTGARGATSMAGDRLRRLAGREVDSVHAHEQVATQLAEVLGDMKGAAMKLGQLLSFVDIDLPDDVQNVYRDALAKLRDSAPEHDPEAIEQVLVEAYGEQPEDTFAAFDRKPLAAASIGQVHAATLHDGTDVVVKVQYPGVAEAVRADLRNAEVFAPLGRFISPNQEIEPLLEELRERIDDELDYAREAQYQRAFATRYRDHPFIHVPDVVTDLCRSQVLVSERIRGQRFSEFVDSASAEDQQRVGEIIFRYAFGSIGRFRLFNGDPHPGNYLIEDPGSAADGGLRVAFLDYGSVKMFSKARYTSMRRIEDALSRGDRERALGELKAAGFMPKHADLNEDEVYAWFQLYIRPVAAGQPFTFTPEFAAEVIRSTTDPRSKYADVLRKLNLPSDYLLLNRIQFGLNSVLGQLGAFGDWRAIRDEYVTDAEPSTELGEQDARWWHTRKPR